MSETATYTYNAPMFPGMHGTLVYISGDTTMFIPCVLDNMDYQSFLAWIAAGNPAPAGWSGPTNPT